MPTRLQVQENIKNILLLSKVRVVPAINPFEINVYFESASDDLETILVEKIIELCPAHLYVNVKPYNELLTDNISPEIMFPEIIEHFALHTSGNMKSFTTSIEKALTDINILNIHFDKDINTIFIETDSNLAVEQIQIFTVYAQEIAPLGTLVKIIPAQ